MLRILITTDHLEGGGVASVTKRLANAFVKKGFQVSILLTHYKSQENLNGINNDVEILTIKYHSLMRFFWGIQLFRIYQFIKFRQPDLTISNKDHVGLFLAILKTFRLIDVKIIHNPQTTVGMVYKNSKRPLQKLRMLLCKLVFRNIDLIVNSSEAAARDTKDFYNLDDVAVVWNAITEPSFFYCDEVMTTNPFDNSVINILACGRLSSEKNYELMLCAFAKAVRCRPDLMLTILGEGEMYEELRLLCNNLNISKHVNFKGKVENVLDYMRYADLFWMTSLYEGLPTVIVEALSQGCAVLSTDCNHGPREILDNGKYGRLVSSYDVDENAKGLIKAIEIPRAPKSFYIERSMAFSADNAAKKYLELAGLE
jgi:glycosyltransferase involved in cell wall biosynthesis